MTGRKKHLRVLKDLRIQHEAYMSTNPNAKMYEKEDKDIADALDYVISVLEQEPILDKIRAEIEQTSETVDGFLMHDGTKRTVLQIIDKYKAESDEKENADD